MTENTPLKIHDLRPAPGANKAKVRKGRGEASKGKTAGRGTKAPRPVRTSPSASRVARFPSSGGCRS